MSTPTSKTLEQAIVRPIIPSLQAGAATGICGFLAGGTVGILRSSHPGLAATFTGVQFFVLGSSFLYTREALLYTSFSGRTKTGKTISSTVAGAISGAAAGAFYGRVNSVAGAFFVGGIGCLGQTVLNTQVDVKTSPVDKRPLLDRLADSKWIPFKSISNVEYESMLTEKLLKIEAEIAIIDEQITSLHNTKK